MFPDQSWSPCLCPPASRSPTDHRSGSHPGWCRLAKSEKGGGESRGRRTAKSTSAAVAKSVEELALVAGADGRREGTSAVWQSFLD